MSGLHLYEGYGIELEYMIVDARTLHVLPVADEILRAAAGELTAEVEAGPLRWSNELVLHVVELKTNGPAPTLRGLAGEFVAHAQRINGILEPLGGRLMPSATHPWMDPHVESRLWPYEQSPIYDTYDRIFGCQGHGWSNLQSLHINLPFQGDEEFGALHAAVRLVLPLLPAIAASSPVLDGRITGLLDTRLQVYRENQRRIPSLTGRVIPEPVFTRADYENRLLRKLYEDIAPHDPDGILQEEWLNSRGAIARFERDTIEIRVIDVQETPTADLAITAAVVAVIRALTDGRLAAPEAQRAWEVQPLAELLTGTIHQGERSVITDAHYLSTLGFPERSATAGEVWQHLVERFLPTDSLDPEVAAALRVLLEQGPLARRLLRALGEGPSRDRLAVVYRELCDCLAEGRPFLG